MAFTHTFPVAFLTIISALLFARLTSILSQILSSTHCPHHTAWTRQSPGHCWRQPPWGEEEVQCYKQGTTEERWKNLKGVVMKSAEGNVRYLKGKVARKP